MIGLRWLGNRNVMIKKMNVCAHGPHLIKKPLKHGKKKSYCLPFYIQYFEHINFYTQKVHILKENQYTKEIRKRNRRHL